MIDGKRVLGLVPARGGSKGIPHKNIVDVAGKPLIAYTIEAALASGVIDSCVVTTDDERIAEVARQCGASVPFLRPPELASDFSPTIDCVIHAVSTLEAMGETFDILVLLQPTSPLRTAEDIAGAVRSFVDHGCRGLVTVVPATEKPIFLRTMNEQDELTPLLNRSSTIRRQDMPTFWRMRGIVYVNAISEVTPDLSFNDNPIGWKIDPSHAFDIDTPEDLEAARAAILAARAAQ